MLRNSFSCSLTAALILISSGFWNDAHGQDLSPVAQNERIENSDDTESETVNRQNTQPSTNITNDALRSTQLFHLGQLEEATRLCQSVLLASPDHLEMLLLQRRLAIASDDENLLIKSLQGLQRTDAANGARWISELEILGIQTNLTKTPLKELQPQTTSLGTRLRSALGIVVFLLIAFLLSSNRSAVNRRIIFWGLGLQFLFALLILRTPPGRWIFEEAKSFIEKVLALSDQGAGFIFGKLANGNAVNYVDAATGDPAAIGMVFAFQILPTVIFFGALMSVLYHLGIIQALVRAVAALMSKTMGTSGAESLSAAGNIFVGQTESPLIIKPYVNDMTRSELMAVMCGGFATVAGGVLAAYARFGVDPGHLLAASVMSAPAALVMAKILEPETLVSKTADGSIQTSGAESSNILDAAAGGASDGLSLALNVAAMLIAFISLVAMVDWILGSVGGLIGFDALSLKWIFGWVFYPLSFCMGVDTQDLHAFGQLLGSKIAVNEFVAYIDLGVLSATMTERSTVIGTYALCGFANFSSIGIQIGGIGAIAPGRRADLAALGLKAMIGGAFASWMTACVAGLLL